MTTAAVPINCCGNASEPPVWRWSAITPPMIASRIVLAHEKMLDRRSRR
jgi:hypothetical protein